MGVAHCRFDIRVPKCALQLDKAGAIHERMGRETVAQIVKANIFHLELDLGSDS